MRYLLDYKVFEEESKLDLSDELKKFGNELQKNGKKLQDEILKIALKDPDLKNKIENREKSKDDQKTNEGLALGLALSSGAILELTGKFLSVIGKKISKKDENKLSKIGKYIEHYGHGIHHGIIKVINKILKPLIFWMDEKKQEAVSNAVFMTILAIKVMSGSVDPSDYKSMGSFVEGLLNGLKSTEVLSFLRDHAKYVIDIIKSM